MPEGVELGAQSDPGVAPADVAPSPMKQAIPDTFHFPLKVDPLPDQLPNASIDLGDVAVDSKTGRATLNGQPLSKSEAADAAAGCAGAEKGKDR